MPSKRTKTSNVPATTAAATAWSQNAARMGKLGTETAFVVLAKAKKLEAQGHNVIHFEIGEPDFDTPKHIVDAGATAITSGDTHYTAAAGKMEFRQAIADHVKRTRDVDVRPDQVVVTPGGKPILYFALTALIDARVEVIYPNPGFPIYESMIRASGGIPVPLPLQEERNFRFDPEELRRLVTPRTRMIIINSPQNPTGGILTTEELQVVAELAIAHDLIVLSDEIYDMIMYDNLTHQSIISLPGMADRTILLCGHSKNYAMTGWRLGYGVFPGQLADGITRLATNSNSCTAAFTQTAGMAALTGPQDDVHAMVAEFEQRRNVIVEALNGMGLRCQAPEGAFYVMPSIADAGLPEGMGSIELADYMLQEAHVAVLDGDCFGKYGQGYIRLSYANSMENIREGMRRMREALERIRADPAAVPSRYIRAPTPTPDLALLDDVGFVTSMLFCTICNYAQTGHFGGPLSYTPANVAVHLLGPEHGGLKYDIRDPKSALADKFMLTGGHCIPTCYALWMILYESMQREFEATGDQKFRCNPEVGMYAIDALGFRRSPGACQTLLADNNLSDHPVMAQARVRGIRALMGHSETTDVTNDVNGGPSGIGAATTAGRAMFWDIVGAPEDMKVMAFEGEFAFTEGHAQELKTMALAQQVGKRLRLFFSYNDAGIDDSLTSGVIPAQYSRDYCIAEQFTSYGWNVFEVRDGSNYEALTEVFTRMENWDASDRRPMVVIANTVKGWWPAATADGQIRDIAQITGYKSHPYGHKMNSPYFCALADTFEEKFGVQFVGIRDGKPATEQERLIQCKQNVDVCLSVLDANNGALRTKIANKLVSIAESLDVRKQCTEDLRIGQGDAFRDERLQVANIPVEKQTVTVTHPSTGESSEHTIALFEDAGKSWGTRRAVSELGKWCNYVTGNRWVTIAADLSNSINVEAATFTGHYDPATNPSGTRLKAGIQECGNAATVAGLVSQTVSSDAAVHSGVWGVTGTYGAFTPLFYTPLRIFSQQRQDSPFACGVVTVVAGHSGPETAADGRSHFGIHSTGIWELFPKNQIINLHCADYNDVCPAYFAAVEMTQRADSNAGIIVLHVARPDKPIHDRSTWADSDIKASAKGCYVIREYAEGPRSGTILVRGCSSTFNTLSIVSRLEEANINVRIVACISEELFSLQSQEYQDSVFSAAHRYDCMVVSTGSKRQLPFASVLGAETEGYSLTSDYDDRWRTGGSEADVIAEARLDAESIYEGIYRFATERDARLERQRQAMAALASL